MKVWIVDYLACWLWMIICIYMNVENIDGSEDEDEAGGYYEAKASKKKEKKRQEREAQRQVTSFYLWCFKISKYNF